MTELAGWENVYVIVGSSAGALIGLQFVVITLISQMCSDTVVETDQEKYSPMKKFFLLWFLLALPIGILLSSLNVPTLCPLAIRGVPTCGTVTGFEPNNHREVRYSYEVNGKLYSASQQGGTGEQSGASYCRSGTSDPNAFRVFYLPEKPAVSCMGSPRALLKNELVFIAVAMLILPPFALFGWWWRSARFRQWLKGRKRTPS